MAHYHVVENTPGYLPDSEPACFRTLRGAQDYARQLAQELRDEDYHVFGNASDVGYYEAVRDADDLGRRIEIVEMDGQPCPDAAD